jgi:hypothetical protein
MPPQRSDERHDHRPSDGHLDGPKRPVAIVGARHAIRPNACHMKSALPVLAVGLCAVVPLVRVAAGVQSPQSPVSASSPAPPACRIRGRVTTGNIPLPGVSIVVPLGAAHQAVTSTDTDGSYSLALAPDATYHLSADFVGFVGTRRDLLLGTPPCEQTIDLELALQPRNPASPSGAESAAAGVTIPTQRAPSVGGSVARSRSPVCTRTNTGAPTFRSITPGAARTAYSINMPRFRLMPSATAISLGCQSS